MEIKSQILHLATYAVERGCVVSVWDSEEWTVSGSTNPAEIYQACDDVTEICHLHIKKEGKRIGTAIVSVDGLEPEEQIIDCTDNSWFDDLTKDYDAQCGELTCYQCEKTTTWLAPDSRCGNCTRLTAGEIKGV